jgi:hypothetical protein
MRVRQAFKRLKKNGADTAAKATITARYDYLADDPAEVEEALGEFKGEGGAAFVAFVRWLKANPRQPGEPALHPAGHMPAPIPNIP